MITSLTLHKEKNNFTNKLYKYKNGEVTYNFTDGINIITGRNGSGKSVLLKIIKMNSSKSTMGNNSSTITSNFSSSSASNNNHSNQMNPNNSNYPSSANNNHSNQMNQNNSAYHNSRK